MKEVTVNTILEETAKLNELLISKYVVDIDLLLAKEAYTTKEVELVAKGVEGKNAEQRKAVLSEMLMGEMQLINSLNEKLLKVNLDLEMQRNVVTAIKYYLRSLQHYED